MASTVLPLGLIHLREGIHEESPTAHRWWLMVEFLTVPICAYVFLAMAYPAALDIAIVVYHSRADALPLLLLVSSLADALLLRVSWPLPSTDALP